MNTLWVDLETRNRTGIDVGSYRYAETSEITVLAYARNNEAAKTVAWAPELIRVLQYDFDERADRIVFHNAEFDVPVLEAAGVRVPFHKVYCTAAQARRHGLPGGLDKLCDLFHVGADKAKMKEGHALVLLFCKPRPDGSWADASTHPAEWAQFLEYARRDVEAMRELHKLMPKWNDAYEAPHFQLDHTINARGFRVDLELCEAAVKTLREDKTERDEALTAATDGAVTAATQRDRILRYLLAEYGVDLPDLQASTLQRRLEDPSLPEPVRELLMLRAAGRRASTSKYAALLKMTCSDGRMRGWRVLNGAGRTGRMSARGYQAHNQPRPVPWFPHSEIEVGIRAMKAGCLPMINRFPLGDYGAYAVRGTIIASPGTVLHVGDWSNIEGRGVAWLAGEDWKLDAFRDFDAGIGPDLYKVAFARAFNRDVADVDKAERQIGKVMELMLGYGGGVAAFITGAATYGIDLDAMADAVLPTIPYRVYIKAELAYAETQKPGSKMSDYGLRRETYIACDALKRLWRARHPAIVALWDLCERAAIGAILTGRPQAAGQHLVFDKMGSWMRMRLPSGRYLCYPSAKVRGEKLTFMGFSPYTRTWERQGTWGGTLVENATQGMCADILRVGESRCEAAGFRVVLDVHDEIVAENNLEQLPAMLSCMTKPIDWAPGLPLAAAGFTTDRYMKEA